MSSRGGRHVVAVLATTTTLGYGILFYSYGVLLVPMERDLGWSRSALTGAFSIALLVSALLTIPVGRWLDRHSPRALMATAATAAAVLVAAWGAVSNRAGFYAIWIALGACMAVLFYEPAFTVLTKQFAGAARNRAVMAVTLAAGLASTIFGPLTAWLERTLGWRGATLALGALLGLVCVPLFVRGLRPPLPADDASVPETHVAPVVPTLPGEAVRSSRFWLLTGAYLLGAITTFGVAVHLVPYLIEREWTAGSAATVLGAVGFVQVLGRSMFSRLVSRLPAGPLGTWVLAAKATGLAVLVLVPGGAGVVVFVAVYGAANGLGTLTRAVVIADLYGTEHYGAISGVLSAITAVGGALSPFAIAGAIEAVGSDDAVLLGLVALCAIAAAGNAAAVSPRRPSEPAAALTG